MKPLNLIALLLFLAGCTWALRQSEPSVREIQRLYYRGLMPFLDAGSAMETKARAFLDEVDHSKKLEAELETIRAEHGRLLLIESRYNEVEQENARLRRALDFQQRSPFKVIASRITRRQPNFWWQSVEIDRGEKDGLKMSQPVVADGGLVGKIDRLGDKQASVTLLTDESCMVSAQIEGTAESGIISGLRGQDDATPVLRMKFLSHDAKSRVTPGMRVFTTGRGGLFPANLLIGTVQRVDSGPLDSEALVRPSVDFSDLSTVFILPLQ
jgi:rod shape-determining protein MreC